MSDRKLLIIVISMLLLNSQFNWGSASFLDYIWPNRNAIFTSDSEIKTLPSVPFELSGPEEKFLLEASKLFDKNLSELDYCQQRVILSLKTSCKSLNEEQLGKLSAMLLNCQARSEGREALECADSMSLKDCTQNMSSDMWNAYHLIMNRAKAVCLLIRQEQFVSLVEITVNKLAGSSRDQLENMEEVKKSQKQLQSAALESIDEMIENNSKLVQLQMDLLKVSETNRVNSEANMREIQRQKQLLKSGQTEIATFVTQIKNKIETLAYKLHDINEVSEKISVQLENTANTAIEQNKKIRDDLQQTLNQLKEVKDSISSISKLFNDFQTNIHGKILWMSENLGTGESLVKHANVIVMHMVSLLIGMICLVFVNTELQTRFVFLVTLLTNFVAVLNGAIKSDVVVLFQTVSIVLAINQVIKLLRKYNVKNYFVLSNDGQDQEVNNNNLGNNSKMVLNGLEPTSPRERVPILRNDENHSSRYETSLPTTTHSVRGGGGYSQSAGPETGSEPNVRARLSVYNRISNRTPLMDDDRSSERSRSNTPFVDGNNRCQATTARGTRCQRRISTNNSGYCALHDNYMPPPPPS